MKRLRLYTIITVPVFGFLYVLTAFSVLIVFPFAIAGMKRPVRFILWWWASSTFWAFVKKLHLEGKEYLEKGKKYILIANHSSLFDIMAIMSFYPGGNQDTGW